MMTFKCKWKNGSKEFTGIWNIENKTLLEADIKKLGGELIEILEESEYTGPPIVSNPNKEDRYNEVRGGLRVSRLNENNHGPQKETRRKERYNAPLIEFDPFSKGDNEKPWHKSITFFVIASLVIGVGLAVFIIMKINSRSSYQDRNDRSDSAEPSLQKVMLSAQDISDKKSEDIMYVSGIVGGGQPIAIIGGQMFKVGDMVNGYKIKTIGSNYVEFLDKSGHTTIKEVGK